MLAIYNNYIKHIPHVCILLYYLILYQQQNPKSWGKILDIKNWLFRKGNDIGKSKVCL
jgi:hypothetical protein